MPLLPNMETSDYLDILRRRKWYIVFSILLVLFGASVYSVVAPEKYKSSTTILVVAQRVPEGYVRSTISTRVDERLFTIRQQVLSRTRLLAVMEELGLYKEERKKLPAEEVVEMMRKSIDIQVASATDKGRRRRDSSEDAFTLTVTHGNPQIGDDDRLPAGLLLHRREPEEPGAAGGGHLRVPRVAASGDEGPPREAGGEGQAVQAPVHGGAPAAASGEPADPLAPSGPAEDEFRRHPVGAGPEGLPGGADRGPRSRN